MRVNERKILNDAIDQIMADDGDFDVAMTALCTLAGRTVVPMPDAGESMSVLEVSTCMEPKHFNSENDVPDIVKEYRRDSLLKGDRDKFSFNGAWELDIDNIRVSDEQAKRSLEILKRLRDASRS